jgi:hypothetical protein
MIIINFWLIRWPMDSLNLYSDSDHEEEKLPCDPLDSLSPTPSPQPSRLNLHLSHNSAST